MKKTEKVSIGRYAFTLDESAYEIINDYLNRLENYYLSQNDGAEIMEGIEERIAELLRERFCADNVIYEKNIQEIINIIGKPEAITDETDSNSSKKDNNRFSYNNKRHLYRNMSNRMIGGVCSGLATYFDTDLLLVRIIFLLLFVPGIFINFSPVKIFGMFFLISIFYLALWAIIPAAKTAKQRWEMRGENGSLDDLCRNIENGTREIGDMAKKVVSSNAGHVIVRTLAIILGVILLFASISGLTSIILFTFSIEFANQILCNIDGYNQSILDFFQNNFPLLKIALLATLIIPCLGMLYGSVMLLFNLKTPKWKPGMILFILWLISIILLFVVFIIGALNVDNCNNIFDNQVFIDLFPLS